jgi:hypothetical protein
MKKQANISVAELCKHGREFKDCVYCNPDAMRRLMGAVDRLTARREKGKALRARKTTERPVDWELVAEFIHRDAFLAVQYMKSAQMMGRDKALEVVWNSYMKDDSVMLAGLDRLLEERLA